MRRWAERGDAYLDIRKGRLVDDRRCSTARARLQFVAKGRHQVIDKERVVLILVHHNGIDLLIGK